MTEELLPFCECGECGLRVTKPGNRFIIGHNCRGISHTPKHNAAISKALTGIPRTLRTPEHCAAMSDSMKNSDAMQIEHDRQRGGQDIVGHHWLYDHADLSKNTVKMARKDHTSLHRLLQKLGYIIPHINTEESS